MTRERRPARIGIAQALAGDLDSAEQTWELRQRLWEAGCGCAIMRRFADVLGKTLST